MIPTRMSSLILLSLLVLQAYAGYDTFTFLRPPTDNTTIVSCPGLGISCAAPDNVCAHDRVLDKYYCCSGSDYPLCRAYATECSGQDGGPSASQLTCDNAGSSWCCLETAESCTQRTGQTNICLATQENIIANLSNDQLRAAYNAVTAASPSATTYTFDAIALAASAASTTSSTTSSAPSTSTSVVLTTSSPAVAAPTLSNDTAPQKKSDSTPGGTIAGAVVGGVGGLALASAAALFFLRRRRSNRQIKPDGQMRERTSAYPKTTGGGYYDVGYQDAEPAPRYTLAEMESPRRNILRSELPSNAAAVELDGPVLGELPGSTPAKSAPGR